MNDIVRDSYGMLLYELVNLEGSRSKAIIVEKGGQQLAQYVYFEFIHFELSCNTC